MSPAAIRREEAQDHRDATSDWAPTNRRRVALIEREVAGTITASQAVELSRLQRVADLRTDLLAPFDPW